MTRNIKYNNSNCLLQSAHLLADMTLAISLLKTSITNCRRPKDSFTLTPGDVNDDVCIIRIATSAYQEEEDVIVLGSLSISKCFLRRTIGVVNKIKIKIKQRKNNTVDSLNTDKWMVDVMLYTQQLPGMSLSPWSERVTREERERESHQQKLKKHDWTRFFPLEVILRDAQNFEMSSLSFWLWQVFHLALYIAFIQYLLNSIKNVC